MRDTQFGDVLVYGMLMAKNGDVEVVDAGGRRGGGYKCSVRSKTHLGIRYDVMISARRGRHVNVPCMTRGARSART